MYVSKSIGSIQTIDDLNFTKTCQCSKCAVETLYIRFDYGKISYILGGMYRHPNGNIKHFIDDLESTLTKNDNKCTAIFVRDINIDLIKYENSDNSLYMSTLMSYGYLPFVTLPTRITGFSATCIDYIFIRDTNNSHRHEEVACGIFYCDITDHLPCFVTLKHQSNYVLDRPLTRQFGERNTSKFRELMTNENWDIIFIEGTVWYTNFIKLVHNKFEAYFPLVKVSRQRIKDKPWITKELKMNIKEKNKLYRVYLKKGDERSKIRYNQQKNIVRNALRIAETNYYNELFENT